MHVLTIVRKYLGISQAELANAAALSQPDLSEMETKEPYGRHEKYKRVAEVLGLPMEPIMKNSISSIPLSFFDEHPPQQYMKEPTKKESLIGRKGEDFIFMREQERLKEILPVHSRLVLPLYKMKRQRVGYDILSYDDWGKPIYLEVKTTCEASTKFTLTANERKVGQKLTDSGEQYRIVHITEWDTERMCVQDISFTDLTNDFNIVAHNYYCTPKNKRENGVTGFAYYRNQFNLKESEVAEVLGIPQYEWSIYETGSRTPPVNVLLTVSVLFDVTVDQLLDTYASKA